jgi:Flp pilus assembly protein TadG
VALVSAVMIGFGALVVDLGRLFTVQTELQHAADAAALAGAVELDGTATAITRAQLAATSALAIANRQTFGSGGSDITFNPNTDIRFLSSLPATDNDPVTAANVTIDPTNAFYIEVTAAARQVDYLLAPVLAARVGGDGVGPTSGQVSAVAVAGINQVVCDFPPLMICNPAEILSVGAPFSSIDGTLIQLKAKGGSGQWEPGNFGLLDSPTAGQGTPAVMENIATASPKGCFNTTVDLRTGAASNPIAKAFNVRFDMYENPGFGGSSKNQSKYKPAPNVIKGKYKSGGSYVDYPPGSPAAGAPMPRDACFLTDTCAADNPTWAHPRFQPPLTDGDWSGYMETNHPGTPIASVKVDIDTNADGVVTRTEMYEWENATAVPVGDTDGDGDIDAADAATSSSATGENGKAMEYGGAEPADVKRRLMNVAVINCIADGPMNGNTNDVPVVAFAKMFLSHAAEDGSDQTIYAEMVGTLQPGIDDELHDIVQLYR